MIKPADTTDEALLRQLEIWRNMSGSDKIALSWEWSRQIRATLEAGIRSRHPDYSDDDVRLTAIRRELGDDLFRQAYPDSPLLSL
ncbi:hypothetical protein HQ560_16565 [bacterium]|nr:hypothetical protein [bacterium]